MPDPSVDESPGVPSALLTQTLLTHSRREAAVAPLPAATSLVTPAATAAVQPAAAENIALIMGGSGTQIPSEDYIQAAFDLYVNPHAPVGTIPQQLVTPEGLYPITPYPYVKVLPLML